MYKLSIITINYNNAVGLDKTIKSVDAQSCKMFEHIIVDGGSTDGSVDIIKKYNDGRVEHRWVSEPDKGIYNAMNKGIRMAKGQYLQFLNSGDCLAGNNVVSDMLAKLEENAGTLILYGNMLKDNVNGRILRDRGNAGKDMTFLDFFKGTLNHSPAYIKTTLFDEFGLYDEDLKIVSDWKWYMDVVVVGGVKPLYADIDVSIFDMNGISETNHRLCQAERELVLQQMFPQAVLKDYRRLSLDMVMMDRCKCFGILYGCARFILRFANKLYMVKHREILV